MPAVDIDNVKYPSFSSVVVSYSFWATDIYNSPIKGKGRNVFEADTIITESSVKNNIIFGSMLKCPTLLFLFSFKLNSSCFKAYVYKMNKKTYKNIYFNI